MFWNGFEKQATIGDALKHLLRPVARKARKAVTKTRRKKVVGKTGSRDVQFPLKGGASGRRRRKKTTFMGELKKSKRVPQKMTPARRAAWAKKRTERQARNTAAGELGVEVQTVKKLPDGRWGVKVPKKTRR